MKKICIDKISPRARAVGFTEKFWEAEDVLRIKFMNGSATNQNYVKDVCREWTKYSNLKFDFTQASVTEIRISFDNSGSWSYIGKDCLNISQNQATMNFGWLDNAVVLHEFGHALGLGHEHQNPQGGIQWNVDAVVEDLSGPPNYWDYNTIYWNVLMKYNEIQVNGTELDPLSIMMYSIPNEWTLNDFATGFNNKLSDKDKKFINSIYPFSTTPDPEMEKMIKAFRYVFSRKSELLDLNEGPIVRIGRLVGADTHMKLLKSDNISRVLKILDIKPPDTDGNTDM